MATIDGRITLVQESRFRPWCAAEPAQLVPLAADQTPVRVKYKAGKDVIGQVAQRIDLRAEAAR